MTNPGTSKVKLQITTPSDLEIAMTRVFDAPRRLVFHAFTKPELVKKWLLGPPGWTMPICEIDLRVGGQYRYVWRRESNGKEMGMGGAYREIVPQERLVCTELFDEAWYAGESVITTTLVEQGGRTVANRGRGKSQKAPPSKTEDGAPKFVLPHCAWATRRSNSF